MAKKNFVRIIMFIIGLAFGVTILPPIWSLTHLNRYHFLNSTFLNACIGGLIFLLLSLLLENYIIAFIRRLENGLRKKSITTLFVDGIGCIIGLVIGVLISLPLYRMTLPVVNNLLPACLTIVGGYIGYYITKSRGDEFKSLFAHRKNNAASGDILERKAGDDFRQYKILDTSVIIDGRIYDIAKTGFIDGTILIPRFVLYELQYIADSADSLKRVRGRRGLDILNSLQKEPDIHVEMYEGDFDDIDEVDTKLIRLAKMIDGVVVTNDYNLNKVCEFQHVPVLNINALANAVKPVAIPGETMQVQIVKEGTERSQGVAYLDDGTMVVVEDARDQMNKVMAVVVTTSLQTDAGRMIFAKPLNPRKNLNHTENKKKIADKAKNKK